MEPLLSIHRYINIGKGINAADLCSIGITPRPIARSVSRHANVFKFALSFFLAVNQLCSTVIFVSKGNGQVTLGIDSFVLRTIRTTNGVQRIPVHECKIVPLGHSRFMAIGGLARSPPRYDALAIAHKFSGSGLAATEIMAAFQSQVIGLLLDAAITRKRQDPDGFRKSYGEFVMAAVLVGAEPKGPFAFVRRFRLVEDSRPQIVVDPLDCPVHGPPPEVPIARLRIFGSGAFDRLKGTDKFWAQGETKGIRKLLEMTSDERKGEVEAPFSIITITPFGHVWDRCGLCGGKDDCQDKLARRKAKK